LTGKEMIGAGEEHQTFEFGESGCGGHSIDYFTRFGDIFPILVCVGFREREAAGHGGVKKRQSRDF
jgi:hypothetical protein